MTACKRVQEARPRASTSGGQSSGRVAGTEAIAAFVAPPSSEVFAADMAAQAPKDVQERHLVKLAECSYLRNHVSGIDEVNWLTVYHLCPRLLPLETS